MEPKDINSNWMKYIWNRRIMIIRNVLSFKSFVNNCFIDITNIKNLPNVF